jgi:hypothetical protein
VEKITGFKTRMWNPQIADDKIILRAALDNKILKRLAAVPVKLTIRAIHGLIWTPARIRAQNG